MNQNSYSQLLCVFVVESHLGPSGDVCRSWLTFLQKKINMRVISRRYRWRKRRVEEKKVKKGVNILLPAPLKDTDGNIITQGPRGGT